MSNPKKVRPIGGFILVKPEDKDEKTASGLIIQTSDKERPQRGEVVSLGTGKLDSNGNPIPWNVKQGDIVMFKKYAPEEVEVEGVNYLIMQESDILAVVEK